MAMEDQFEIMEANFTETYIEYPDPHELELDSEKDEEVHEEIPDESMDESVIYFEEVKEFEFESVEYLYNSSPHPPPEKPIFLRDNFENLEEKSVMVPLACSFSTSQPKDELIQNYEEMEGNFSLSMSCHYEYWLVFHLDSHEQQSIQNLHVLSYSSVWLKGRRSMILDSHEQQSIQNLHVLSYSSVWLKGRRSMILGWFFLTKNSKLIKLGKGVFCESSWTRMFQTLVASFHLMHG
jgi:hypothetical protein